MAPPEDRHQSAERQEPDGEPERDGAQGLAREPGSRRAWRLFPLAGAGTKEADESRRQHDDGKGHAEEEDRNESGRRDRPMLAPRQRAPADAQERLDDDDEHRGFDAEEEGRHQRQIAEGGIDEREREYDKGAGEHEQQAGGEPTLVPVQAPADICGELHGLGPRQQHAETERAQEPRLRQPALFLHDDPMHEGDLGGRPAEGEQADARPDPKRLGERGRLELWHCRRCFIHGSHLGVIKNYASRL